MYPAMIGGARSPITTKKAIHVPPRKPIIETSIANFPAAPNTLKAIKDTLWYDVMQFERLKFFY